MVVIAGGLFITAFAILWYMMKVGNSNGKKDLPSSNKS
jgi:hypothetical protein